MPRSPGAHLVCIRQGPGKARDTHVPHSHTTATATHIISPHPHHHITRPRTPTHMVSWAASQQRSKARVTQLKHTSSMDLYCPTRTNGSARRAVNRERPLLVASPASWATLVACRPPNTPNAPPAPCLRSRNKHNDAAAGMAAISSKNESRALCFSEKLATAVRCSSSGGWDAWRGVATNHT